MNISKAGALIGTVFVIRELFKVSDLLLEKFLKNGNNLEISQSFDLSSENKSIKKGLDKQGEEIQRWYDKCYKRDFSIRSIDNQRLCAKVFYQRKKTDDWVIIAHGYGCHKETMLYAAEMFYNKGFNVLLPDMRCHGKSGGKYIGMGILDKNDLLEWSRKIINANSNANIILYGVSMGGASVLMASSEKQKGIRAVISDCSFCTVNQIFSYNLWHSFHIPPYPILNFTSLLCKIKGGYFFEEASVIKSIKKSQYPILLCHGLGDSFVPPSSLKKLYKNANSEVKAFVVRKAGHGVSSIVAKEEYWKRVFDFIDNQCKKVG